MDLKRRRGSVVASLGSPVEVEVVWVLADFGGDG